MTKEEVMRSREEVLREFGLPTTKAFLTTDHIVPVRAMADRIRELESPPHPSAAAGAEVVEVDEWRVVDKDGLVFDYAYPSITEAQNDAREYDRVSPECAPHRVMRVCLRPVDSHQSVPSDNSAPVVPVVAQAERDAARYRFFRELVCNEPHSIPRNFASCLYYREVDEAIDGLMKPAASEVRG